MATTTCSCHLVREGAGGISYSYAIIGIRCPGCEQAEWEYEQELEWNALTPEEQAASIAESEARKAAEDKKIADQVALDKAWQDALAAGPEASEKFYAENTGFCPF